MRTIYLLLILFFSLMVTGCIEEEPPIIEEDIYYTVTFYGFEGIKLGEATVLNEESVTAPSVPEVAGYTFIGWDEDFSKVESNLEVRAIYELNTYTVYFYSDEEVIKEEVVGQGESATAPSIKKTGYFFKGWDGSFTNVTEDRNVYAMWEKYKEYGSSYVEELEFSTVSDYSALVNQIDSITPSITLGNVKHGGARGTNELVYYDGTFSFNTNIYGFEIAVDNSGIVIDRATKVNIPNGGFVLSAHGTSMDRLEAVKVGDILSYKQETKEVLVYRKVAITNTISIGVEINRLKEKVKSLDANYVALDYKEIHKTLNDAILIYNNLIESYNIVKFEEARNLLLDISFMSIEPSSVTIRAMWHYPLRAGGYTEKNQDQVEEFLDKVKLSGINRIYLNTNFNGKAIYASDYLVTTLTGTYTYGDYEDYLDCFITEAHERNIEVYAWTNTLIAGDGTNNQFYASKDWLLKGFNGEDNNGGMYFIDISNDDAFAFLLNVFGELASKYNLDGIEYDFIRYPNGNLHTFSGEITNTANVKDWGYTTSFLSKFKEEYSLTEDIKELIRTSELIRNNFLDFKLNLLTKRVEELSSKIRESNPDIKISAAVMPSISGAKKTYLQDWETWIKAGYVDVLEPMIYTADNDHLKSSISSMMKVVGNYALIVAGIFPEGSGGASSMNADQIAALESLGIAGASKFSSRTIFNGLLKDSLKYMARDYIVQPSTNIDVMFNAYTKDLRDKVTNYYLYKDSEEVIYMELIELINGFEIIVDLDYELAFNEIEELISSINNDIIRVRLENEHLKIGKYIKVE